MDERRKYELSQAESERVFRQQILPKLLEDSPGLTPFNKPTIVVVGGQPAVGKSASIGRVAIEPYSKMMLCKPTRMRFGYSSDPVAS